MRDAKGRVDDARRDFFKLLGVGAAGGSGVAAALFSPEALAYGGPYAPAFGLDPTTTFMNIGTTGSTPIAVLRNLAQNNAAIARDPTQSFNTQDMRNIVAPGFGADPFELVMSFNTTDGMNKILHGLEFAPGDEIITTNMEHPGGNSPMSVLADRRGVVLKRVNLPTNDAYSDATVLARFQALLTNNTKAIVFSSPPFLTGIRLPEKPLCQWAASQGLISVIDGAHGPGMLALNFHDIGCDFYAGAGHKWQCGPGQTGILYVRNNTGPAAPSTYTKAVIDRRRARHADPARLHQHDAAAGLLARGLGRLQQDRGQHAARRRPRSGRQRRRDADEHRQPVVSGAAGAAGVLPAVGPVGPPGDRELHRQPGAVPALAHRRHLGPALARHAVRREHAEPRPDRADRVQPVFPGSRLQRRAHRGTGDGPDDGLGQCRRGDAPGSRCRHPQCQHAAHAARQPRDQRERRRQRRRGDELPSAADLDAPVPLDGRRRQVRRRAAGDRSAPLTRPEPGAVAASAPRRPLAAAPGLLPARRD
ncbi:MAG: aminotransferase class V-fold PLP-dependent enzyme [Comamonadaceae bacterium]|nr:aminotransferase class V-fold PLP-dependent enzyme [Comamonadaceae bacterium]